MSGLFGGPSTSTATSNTVGDLKQDVEVQQPPSDGITDLAFNPNQSSQQDFLAVSSWDKKVRLYEVTAQGQAQPRHAYDHEGPVFSVDWFKVTGARSVVPPGHFLHFNEADYWSTPRMAQKLSLRPPTSKSSYVISLRNKRCK
jgi:WD40 repeat protein